jgi:type IV secretion system protein VirD4
MDNGDWQHARPERAVLLLGLPRSGKTSGVIIPGLLSHAGRAVCTSTKLDVARATSRARSRSGRVWVFGATGANRGAGDEELRWSPVRASVRWDGAMLMARRDDGGSGRWDRDDARVALGQALPSAASAVFARAALDGRDMESVLDWVMRCSACSTPRTASARQSFGGRRRAAGLQLRGRAGGGEGP